ncbi:MAG: hypothetical protein HRU69_03115 [Flammeovirgaceae bacterium]|nr:MAG: hypothetical protein HRU69_03115 [Flammeovirgaceae bacterium]
MKFSSDSHNRAVRSIAQLMEVKLIELENLLRIPDHQKPISMMWVNDLTTEEVRLIKQTIQELFGVLVQFRDHYEIKPVEISLKRDITFKTALLWQEISGATGKNMEGYGSLDKGLKKEFEEYTSRMSALVNTLYQVSN